MTAIFITSRIRMQKIRPAMEIAFHTGLRKSPGKMSFCLVYSVGNVYELYDEHCAHEELLFAYVHVWKILRAGWKIAAAYGGAGASFGVRWLPCGKDV